MQEFRPKYNFFWQIFDIFCKVTAGAEKTLILHFFSKHFVTRDTRALALFTAENDDGLHFCAFQSQLAGLADIAIS